MIRIAGLSLTGADGSFRASATLKSDRGPNGELWFEVQGAALPDRAMAASAFVAALTPISTFLGENLTIDEPIEKELALGIEAIARGYTRNWGKPPIHVAAEGVRVKARENRIVATSFSGGADSFFTLKTHLGPESVHLIEALAIVLGFDTPLEATDKHAELLDWTAELAASLGLRRFVLRTNLRPLFDPHANWGGVTHIGCLAAFAFLLSGSVHTYLVPSSYSIDELFPTGSHALLDSAWISGPTRTLNEGWEYDRDDKIRAIMDWAPARENLRVCASRTSKLRNCGRCEKCVRTMINLRLLGAPEVPIFPHPLTPQIVRDIRIHAWRSQDRYRRYRQRLLSAKRDDLDGLASAIGIALLRGRARTLRYRIRAIFRG